MYGASYRWRGLYHCPFMTASERPTGSAVRRGWFVVTRFIGSGTQPHESLRTGLPRTTEHKESQMDQKKLRYAKTHEWASLEGDLCSVGITKFAVDQLTDIVYIELP